MLDKLREMDEKREERVLREERINAAIENYSFRPKVEADAQRLVKETEGRELRKRI
jgi:hypothetical protein